jgi:hypothetical protein
MAVEYHTHTFPTATRAEVETGTRDDVAVSPASLNGALVPVSLVDVVRGNVRMTVGPTAPFNPALNDVWIDTA